MRIEVGKIVLEVDAIGFGSPRMSAVIGALQEARSIIKGVVDGVGMAAVDANKATVAADYHLPSLNIVELLGAVILAAAVGDVGIGRMESDSGKLGDLQIAID